MELRTFVRSFGRSPTVAQRLAVVKRRRSHKLLVDSFIRRALEIIGEDAVTSLLETQEDPDTDNEGQGEYNDGLGEPAVSVEDPERQLLPFPSAFSSGDMASWTDTRKIDFEKLRETELALRRGHAEDCLEAVRGALIQLSWVFKNKVRGSEGADRTRSYDRVKQLDMVWRLQRRVYNLNRKAMLILGDVGEINTKFPVLEKSECTVKTAVESANERGQSRYRLPWFWSADRGGNLPTANSDHHDECE